MKLNGCMMLPKKIGVNRGRYVSRRGLSLAVYATPILAMVFIRSYYDVVVSKTKTRGRAGKIQRRLRSDTYLDG